MPQVYRPSASNSRNRSSSKLRTSATRNARTPSGDPRRSRPMLVENNGGPVATITDEQDAVRAALDGLRTRAAGGEHIAQSAIAEAVRRAACSDLAAQFTKRWKCTP